ncbi:MAG: prolipoprotein diacylglyceryl transferase [Oscillatoriales cyanobacterium SM2_1_8]|nr:prolipoprotein diacylglyceryl transferase [Oscillatoriales cyanobacterium SM2_1_8]
MPFAFAFQSPGSEIFGVRWYSLLIASGLVLGTLLAQRLGRQRGIDPEAIGDLAVWLVVGALPGARLYYVLFAWQQYADRPLTSIGWGEWHLRVPTVLAIWEGGIAIHGAILGGLVALWVFSRRRSLSMAKLADVVAPALILGQAIGRWGNFFNSEAFGAPTDLPWKLYIPPGQRPLGLQAFSYFHPTFLYESLWNLGTLGLLLWAFDQPWGQKPGRIAALYGLVYSSGRLWIEGLRTDSLMLGPLRIAQVVSLAAMVGAVVYLGWERRRDLQA